MQDINRTAQNGFSCSRFLLGWQIFALLYNAAGQLHIKGEEAKYWVWIYWDSNQQRTFKRVQGPNNGERRGSQNIDQIQRPCWKPYPWCGNSHLFFDTIVKPLEEKRGIHINRILKFFKLPIFGMESFHQKNLHNENGIYSSLTPMIFNPIVYISSFVKLLSSN